MALDFDDFVRSLLPRIRIPTPVERPTRATSLFETLALDSLQGFEVVLLAEEFAEVLIPPATVPPMFTLGDVYEYYLSALHDETHRAGD